MAAPSYETLERELATHLDEQSVSHSIAVGETARRIADAYGVDPESARIAGLLHDWAREMAAEELLETAEVEALETTPVDRAVPYLLHARVGAVKVRERFPDLPDEIVRAVELHTMGAPIMSDLEMVVYVADMIEPARSFDGVDEIRSSLGCVELDELFAMAYSRSIAHLLEKRRRIHPQTVEVWNAIVAKEHA